MGRRSGSWRLGTSPEVQLWGKPSLKRSSRLIRTKPVEAGKIVWMGLDARTARDFGGANVVKNYRAHYGDAPVDDAEQDLFHL